jgi:sterol desaturase/sphingolipid hydroxylase (fatty acid hydroxylase superfamily)
VIAAAAIVAAALALIAIERRWPYDAQPLWRAGLFLDLVWYGLVQSYVLSLPIAWLVRPLAGPGWVSDWPVWAQIALFVVLHDLYIYWFHRWQHSNRWLWRIHEAHHSARQVDWVSGARSHALEILVNQTIEVAVMVWLGATPDVILAKGAVSVISGMWIHANTRLHLGPLRYLVNGPEQHRWHHAIDYPEPGRNFATKLAIWDHLFGTAYLPPRKPAGYGLGDDRYPRGFVAQQLYAFRRSERASRGLQNSLTAEKTVADRPARAGAAPETRARARRRRGTPRRRASARPA